jgi:hypothetical protein
LKLLDGLSFFIDRSYQFHKMLLSLLTADKDRTQIKNQKTTMKLLPEIEDQYLKDVLLNFSLKDLPGEEWKLIEDFENYAISCYGRVKSLERWTLLPGKKKGKKEPEMIMKLIFVKHHNKYLQNNFYQVHCTLSSEGKKYRKSVARLVFYHFVERFDFEDRNILISCKDDNRLHLHWSNLEKISVSESRYKTFSLNRARNRNAIYLQPVVQYTVEGGLVSDFENMYDAEEAVGVGCESIMDAVHGDFLTAGGFRWFLQSQPPQEKDFVVIHQSKNSDKILNTSLWNNLGKPAIDENNPPACINLSLEDLPEEHWKPIPGFENRFAISDKGRVKRLSGWTSTGRKVFLKEQILSQYTDYRAGKTFSLHCLLRHNKKNTYKSITKLMYHCFVETFDMDDRRLLIINKSEPSWNIDLSKLQLLPVYPVLKGKEK